MELDPIAVGLKFGFLAVLYLFLLWVARSALKDLRRGTEPSYTGPSADYEDATGMYSASAPLGRDGGNPKLRVQTGAGLSPGSAYDLQRGSAARARRSGGHPARGRIRVVAARATHPAGRCDGVGGSRLHERHVPQR